MNRGVLLKTLHEVWVTTVIFALSMLAAEGLLAFVIPRIFSEYAEQILQMDFVRRIVGGLLGTELVDGLGPEMIRVVPWVHPIVLAILWASCITHCTRVPAGEIDRGTVDVLLAWPVSRGRVLLCDSLYGAGAGVCMVLAAWLGYALGGALAGQPYRLAAGPAVAVVANMYCMYLAVGGLAYFVSALSDRRGRAVGVALGVLLASFLLNFLAQLWAPAQSVAFLSVLYYYKPLHVVREGSWPVGDMLVLLVAAFTFWALALIAFTRRDIRTV